jgi:hypothetical protein
VSDRTELVATVLLAVAAVATAWSGYQATRTNAIRIASNYVLGVVLFSVALFFAGMSTKLTNVRLRQFALTVGCAVFLGTLVWIATSPISLAI